jgi:membrane dipeptidase
MQTTRRQFAACLAAAAWQAPDVKQIYARSMVIDALASPFSFNVPWPPVGPLTAVQLESVAKCGITAINQTVSAPGLEATIRNISRVLAEIEKHSRLLAQVRTYADLERARRDGRLGIILGFQDTEMIERDLSRLAAFRGLGVRIIQLTYNVRNLAGDGCLEPGNAGLSAFGRELVARLNELGIAVDLSHCGTATTADGIAVSRKPVLITHSACREIYRHPRNKEDRELRALAERGGVLGVYLMPFLGGAPGPASEELLLRHIEHALKVCGADHVGIGSDLSITPVEETPEYLKAKEDFAAARRRGGIEAPDENRPLYIPTLNHPRRLEAIAQALAKRGHSETVIEKVLGGNFARAFREIWNA